MAERELCGKWMPRARETCARRSGHKTRCSTSASVEANNATVRDRREYMEEFRRTHRDSIRKYQRKYRAKSHDKAATLLLSARKRARKMGLPFNLTIEWVECELERVLANGCPLLSIPIVLAAGKGHSPDAPSIDRINPEAGYTQQNCWIISHRANALKNGASLGMMRKVLDEADRRGLNA